MREPISKAMLEADGGWGMFPKQCTRVRERTLEKTRCHLCRRTMFASTEERWEKHIAIYVTQTMFACARGNREEMAKSNALGLDIRLRGLFQRGIIYLSFQTAMFLVI